MSYTPTDWKNKPSTETPISAANLMKIENCLSALANMTTWTVNLDAGISGSGMIARYGNVCHMSFSVSPPSGYEPGDVVKIWSFPSGFKPTLNLDVALIDATFGATSYVSYNTVNNNLSLSCNSVDAGVLRGTLVYLTSDEPITS